MLAEALMSRKQQTAQESAIFFTLAPYLYIVSPFLIFQMLFLFDVFAQIID